MTGGQQSISLLYGSPLELWPYETDMLWMVICRLLHFIHHKYNKEHSMSPFAGLAFHPLDGIIQAGLLFITEVLQSEALIVTALARMHWHIVIHRSTRIS